MDALTGLLDGPRARNAFLLRAVLSSPWSLRVQDRSPLTVIALARGGCWIVPDGGEPMRVNEGGMAIALGPDPYLVADDPATPPRAIIHSEQHCETLDGRPLDEEMSLGVRTWGNDPDGDTVMLVGTYHLEGEVSRRLLRALPRLLVLDAESWDGALIPLLTQEIVRDEPGQEAVLDRMLDLLLISALRTWFARPDTDAPAWYRAGSDPIVGRALRMLHNNPAHPWTIESLAAAVGVSRATLARRFTDLVGEPPMTFLTGWRLALAADLLRGSEATIATVAERVGYGSAFALSTAFKRVQGLSPQQYRARSAV